MEEPLVSVVIATYKRAALIPRAIESVRRQSHRNLEILVVDDGSPDETERVVREIADKRIRYIGHEHNRGLPAARNTGIRSAAGEFIAFLDDDDGWREDKLSRQLQAVGCYEAVLTGAMVNDRYPILQGKAEISLKDLQKGNNAPPSGLMVRAATIRELWFDENLRQGEDWDVYIRLALRGPIAYVNEPLVFLSDGDHQRMTNEARNLPFAELEKRMVIYQKHKTFFGSYWVRRHSAAAILSYLRVRAGKRAQLCYAIQKYGLLPVLGVLTSKLARLLRRLKADAFARLPLGDQ